jgi:hypothetical protein
MRDVLYAPAVALDVVNRFESPCASNRAHGDVPGGISARLGDHIAIEGTVHTTFSRAEGDVYGGFAGVGLALWRYPFFLPTAATREPICTSSGARLDARLGSANAVVRHLASDAYQRVAVLPGAKPA